jgi:hypothetical protein
VTTGASRAGRFGLLLLSALAVQAPIAARAAGEASPPAGAEPSERAEITVVAGAGCAPRLRDVIADQLADLTSQLLWACRDRLDPEDLFRHPPPPGGNLLRVWIDLRAGAEARLTLERADRFVVRRIALVNGLDELGREQIGQIVRFAALAVRAGEGDTLTRTEARAAVADWPVPPRPLMPAAVRSEVAAPAPRAAVAIAATWSAVAFSREIPLVHELALAAAARPAGSRLAGWLEAGYQLPARYQAVPIGVDLSAAALRVGLAVGPREMRFMSFGISGGIGVQRTWFTPLAAAASVEPAAADAFWSASARLALGIAFRATARLTFGARLTCDFAAADVHYDLRDAGGTAHRVLTPFRVTPGLGLGLSWQL